MKIDICDDIVWFPVNNTRYKLCSNYLLLRTMSENFETMQTGEDNLPFISLCKVTVISQISQLRFCRHVRGRLRVRQVHET